MEFIETPVFTRRLTRFLSDEEYADLQRLLEAHPNIGSLIRSGQGLRKIRWRSSLKAKGKRGGVRVVYYVVSRSMICMAYIYDKSRQSDLSRDETKMLASIIKERI